MEIVEKNDRIHANYENCKIVLTLRDFLGLRQTYQPLQFDDSQIIHINHFICDTSARKKGNGRILLGLVLKHIKTTYFKTEDIMVSLVVSGKKRIDETGKEIKSDDAKLIQYYTKIGFRVISKDNDIMLGRLSFIVSSCESYRGGGPECLPPTLEKGGSKKQMNKTSRNKRYVGQIKTSCYNRKK
jgi:hypothetical protein